MKKKTNKFLVYFLVVVAILILAVVVVMIKKNKKDDSNIIKDRLKSEIAHLDSNLINMLNKTNGISLENYIVQAEKIKKSEESKSDSDSKASSSSKGEGTSSSGASEGDSQTGDGSEQQGKSSDNMNYKMVSNEILLQDRTTDWKYLKSEVERLYTDWQTIMLDLYKVDVNNQDILNFNIDLDTATSAIQKEDKVKTLNALAKLYSYIPKYSVSFSNGDNIENIYKTKAFIINAYVLVEQDNFSKIKQELQNAETSFMNVLNDVNSQQANQVNINKSYILIKELENFDVNTDKEIFYIKYKNLIQNLNNMSI